MPRVKSAQAKAAKRPSVPVRRAPGLRRLVANARPVLLVVGITACVGAGLTAWTSGWIADRLDRVEAAMLALTVELGFGVEEVLVAGRSRTDRDALLSAVGVERGTPILSFRPEMARAAILEIPWVKSVRVERRLPDTILVRVEERRPMAIWQHQGLIRMIDTDGGLIDVEPPRRFEGLPIVVGPDAPNLPAAVQLALRVDFVWLGRDREGVLVPRVGDRLQGRLQPHRDLGDRARLQEFQHLDVNGCAFQSL